MKSAWQHRLKEFRFNRYKRSARERPVSTKVDAEKFIEQFGIWSTTTGPSIAELFEVFKKSFLEEVGRNPNLEELNFIQKKLAHKAMRHERGGSNEIPRSFSSPSHTRSLSDTYQSTVFGELLDPFDSPRSRTLSFSSRRLSSLNEDVGDQILPKDLESAKKLKLEKR